MSVTPLWKAPGDTRRRARALLAQGAAKRAAAQPSYREVPLRLAYELPPVCALTDADARRQVHADLEAMTRDELTTEAWRLRFVLAFGDFSGCSVCCSAYGKPWAEERLQRIRAVLKEGA